MDIFATRTPNLRILKVTTIVPVITSKLILTRPTISDSFITGYQRTHPRSEQGGRASEFMLPFTLSTMETLAIRRKYGADSTLSVLPSLTYPSLNPSSGICRGGIRQFFLGQFSGNLFNDSLSPRPPFLSTALHSLTLTWSTTSPLYRTSLLRHFYPAPQTRLISNELSTYQRWRNYQ